MSYFGNWPISEGENNLLEQKERFICQWDHVFCEILSTMNMNVGFFFPSTLFLCHSSSLSCSSLSVSSIRVKTFSLQVADHTKTIKKKLRANRKTLCELRCVCQKTVLSVSLLCKQQDLAPLSSKTKRRLTLSPVLEHRHCRLTPVNIHHGRFGITYTSVCVRFCPSDGSCDL